MQRPRRQRRWLGIALALSVVLGGCGGAPRVTLAELPAPPGLERYAGAAETPLDGMWSAAILARGRPPQAQEADYYWLPTATPWEAVDTVYRQQLGADWTADTALDLPNSSRWTRSSAAGKQTLVVSTIGISAPQGSVLLVALVTE